MVRVKTGQGGHGQDHAKTTADSGWCWQSRSGLDAEQEHVWQNQDPPCRAALGQAQDRKLVQGQKGAGYVR